MCTRLPVAAGILVAVVANVSQGEDAAIVAASQSEIAAEYPRTDESTIPERLTFREAAGKRPVLFDPNADLAAVSIQFKSEFHFGVDEWHDHRVVAEIVNTDSHWSGASRYWEIYVYPPNSAVHSMAFAGPIPPLAPGETMQFTTYLPESVGQNSTYVLLLSPGDTNPTNDFAVDVP